MSRPRESGRVAEVAGKATAECAAVCCCVPCTVMDLLVLAAYKLPVGLVKKAMRKRNRRLLNKKKNKNEMLLDHGPCSSTDNVALGLRPGPTLQDHLASEVAAEDKLEEEMWAQFNGTGFWRSASQRQPHLQTEEIQHQ